MTVAVFLNTVPETRVIEIEFEMVGDMQSTAKKRTQKSLKFSIQFKIIIDMSTRQT